MGNRNLWQTAFLFLMILLPSVRADLNPLLEASTRYQQVEAKGLVSVDTIVIDGDKKVALIGIEGPASTRPKQARRDEHGFIIPDTDPTTPFGVEAMRFLHDKVHGKKLRLEFDTERRNDEGALWAYVFLPDGTMLNELLLRQGYATLRLRTPNMKYAERFRAAYKDARKEMRGLQGNW